MGRRSSKAAYLTISWSDRPVISSALPSGDPTRIPSSYPKGRNVAVADLPQSNILLLLLCLDLSDMRLVSTPLFLNDSTVPWILAKAQVRPLEHKITISHLHYPLPTARQPSIRRHRV